MHFQVHIVIVIYVYIYIYMDTYVLFLNTDLRKQMLLPRPLTT